jgi:hypothetical protein
MPPRVQKRPVPLGDDRCGGKTKGEDYNGEDYDLASAPVRAGSISFL